MMGLLSWGIGEYSVVDPAPATSGTVVSSSLVLGHSLEGRMRVEADSQLNHRFS